MKLDWNSMGASQVYEAQSGTPRLYAHIAFIFSTMILAGCQVNETGDKPPVKETNMTEKQTSKQSIIPLAVSESDRNFLLWLVRCQALIIPQSQR